MPFVKDSAIPKAKNEYVCWMDIMGTKGKMENSVNTCAIFILKFHAAVLETIQLGCNIKTYPVMDGVYITSTSKSDLEKALFHIFTSLGDLFITEKNFHHKFIVKASVAFGPVIHGKDIGNSVNKEFASTSYYKDSLLLGLPMIQAFTGEKGAPPFGVIIHESARSFAPNSEEPFRFKWWKWFLYDKSAWPNTKTNELSDAIKQYFDTSEKQSLPLDYPVDRIKAHSQAATQYFVQDI